MPTLVIYQDYIQSTFLNRYFTYSTEETKPVANFTYVLIPNYQFIG